MTRSLEGAVLYDSVGPHPRIVRMCAIEKHVRFPTQVVDVRGGENRGSAYMAINPAGTVPALRLADGTSVADSAAICEFLEECLPVPPLLGGSPEERARIRTWIRQIQMDFAAPLILGVRSGPLREMFVERVRLLSREASKELLSLAAAKLDWFDRHLSTRYVAGETFTLADINLFVWVEFAERFGMAVEPAQRNLSRWRAEVRERPSAHSSVDPFPSTDQNTGPPR